MNDKERLVDNLKTTMHTGRDMAETFQLMADAIPPQYSIVVQMLLENEEALSLYREELENGVEIAREAFLKVSVALMKEPAAVLGFFASWPAMAEALYEGMEETNKVIEESIEVGQTEDEISDEIRRGLDVARALNNLDIDLGAKWNTTSTPS